MEKRISTPLTDDVVENLRVGDKVLITGYIYTARDAAHKRMVEALQKGRHVVTANKHLLAEEGVELFQMAEEKGFSSIF